MLKQTEHTDTPTPSAASVRVTPEELAAALAHLDAGRAGQDGKIAIGRAVEELSLDAAPEDILRAVEIARQQTARRRQIKRRGLAALLVGLAAIGGLGATKWALSPRHAPAAPAAAAPIQTLFALPDEQQAFVDTRGLMQAIHGLPAAQVRVYSDGADIRWGIIKHGGKVYVQAYALKTTERKMQTGTFDIYNTETEYPGSLPVYLDGGTDVSITLPLQGFQCRDTQVTVVYATLTVADAHTDDHLWDYFEHNH